MILNNFISCLKKLKEQCVVNIKEYKISELLITLNGKTKKRIHSYKIDSLGVQFNEILDKYGRNAFEDVRKIVLLEFVIQNWEDIFSEKYPESIKEQFERNLKRFLDACYREDGWGEYNEDVYWKDLSIARQQIFPAGAQIVEAYSGFGLMQGLSFNLIQAAKFISLIVSLRGKEGYYQIHTHIPELGEFNEQGWNNCYIRIAEMLEKNEEVKGMFGGSWFYDPQLENISPRLIYLQQVPLNNGAWRFHVGEDRTGNAIAKSKTRLNLYNEGKYIPQSYMVIWPRKELIAWADQFKKDK